MGLGNWDYYNLGGMVVLVPRLDKQLKGIMATTMFYFPKANLNSPQNTSRI